MLQDNSITIYLLEMITGSQLLEHVITIVSIIVAAFDIGMLYHWVDDLVFLGAASI